MTPSAQKTISVAFKTVGCRLNQAETAELSESLKEAGFIVRAFGGPADAVIINTCAVTEKAEKDCIRIAKNCRHAPGNPLIILAGCASEVSRSRLEAECRPDMILGQADKLRIPEILKKHFSLERTNKAEAPARDRTRGTVKIQTGCSFNCTYCIVPAARGKPETVNEQQILSRIRRLADAGVREVVLSGVNLGCFGNSPEDIVNLIRKIEAVERIERIRLSSIEMTTAEGAILEHMRSSPKLCRHLHLPLQSGSTSVLGRMHRKYTAEQFLAFCRQAVSTIPHISIGTDIIAGFPGETDGEFSETLNLVEAIPFSNMHIFQYSRRSGTPAAHMPDQVPAEIRSMRAGKLRRMASEKKAMFAQSMTGIPCSVLIEKVDKAGVAHGWTREYLWAEIASKNCRVNDIIEFTPVRAVKGVLLDT